MREASSSGKKIQLVDYDGTVVNTPYDRIRAMLPEAVRKHGTISDIMVNILFLYGDLLGTGRDIVADETARGRARFVDGAIDEIRRELEKGNREIMTTANGHSRHIREQMLERGLDIETEHCEPGKRHMLLARLKRENPGDVVESKDDSLRELISNIAHGFRNDSILVSAGHNRIAELIGKTGLVRVESYGAPAGKR